MDKKGIEVSQLEVNLMLKMLDENQFYDVSSAIHDILGGEIPAESKDKTVNMIVNEMKSRFEHGTNGWFFEAKE